MKKITFKKTYETALNDVIKLMQKGENNITDKEANTIKRLAEAIQEYEKIHQPFPIPV